jgi:uncharacterized membrane protein
MTVTVLKFAGSNGAEDALERVHKLQAQHLITLHDAAIVSWPASQPAPKTRQLHNLVPGGALSGMFWGILFGLIFAVPFFGLALGAAAGALGGVFRDYGIDDKFIRSVRGAVTSGTSALFLMTSDAVMDRVVQELSSVEFELIATNLSSQDEAKLRDLFAQ